MHVNESDSPLDSYRPTGHTNSRMRPGAVILLAAASASTLLLAVREMRSDDNNAPTTPEKIACTYTVDRDDSSLSQIAHGRSSLTDHLVEAHGGTLIHQGDVIPLYQPDCTTLERLGELVVPAAEI